MQSVLTALKDIPGVVGSFVLSSQGGLIAREMPAIYPDSTFPELGRRLASVSEAMETQVSTVQDLLLKFEGYWLFVRRTTQGFLSILTTETVNFPALKMASNVALKQVAEKLAAVSAVPLAPVEVVPIEPAPAPVPEPAAPATPEPVAAAPSTGGGILAAVLGGSKPKRVWRGQVID